MSVPFPPSLVVNSAYMELLDWLTVVGFGATIFALIVGLFSAYNGRQTRSYIGNLLRETSTRTQELIQTTQAETRQLLERMDRRMEAQQSLLERQQTLLERIVDRQDNILTAVRQSRP